MRGQTYVIFAIIFVIIVAVFAVINVDPVEVNYLFGTGAAPLIFVILFSVLMGCIIMAAVGIVKVFRLQRENKSLRKQLKDSTETVQDNHQELLGNGEEKQDIENPEQDKQL